MARSMNGIYFETNLSDTKNGLSSSCFVLMEGLAKEIVSHQKKTGVNVGEKELSKKFREHTLNKTLDGKGMSFGMRCRRVMWSIGSAYNNMV